MHSSPNLPSTETLSDTHHDILSVAPKPERNLLSHVQVGPADPLALLFAQETLPTDSLLNQVVVEPAAPPSVMLETDKRLSECLLWKLQEEYYANAGINAWASNVPCFITSSVYIAEQYAEMIIAFLDDYYDKLDKSEPIYILELATGSGRFSHMLLIELEAKLASFERFRELRLKYVMTDFTANNPAFWEAHDRFKPFVESGRLDFAVLNPMVENNLTLRVSGETVGADTVKNPVIAIANYFFDSISQDVFRVESKTLMEGLISLERNLEGLEPDSSPVVGELTSHWRYRELRHENYYQDQRLNAVLRHYRHNIKEGTIIFPLGAFDVIRNLEALSNNRLVLISSDKAYTSADHMILYYEHQYAVHGGAFSYMVNYDAIGQYFRNAGGRFLHTTGKNLSIQTVCCVSMDDIRPERLDYFYQQRMNRDNTINSVCALMPDGREMTDAVRLNQLIATIRLNLADPKIFTLLGEELARLLPQASIAHREDLLALMDDAWSRFYHFPGEVNLPFWLSQFHYFMDRCEDSLSFLDQTIAWFGPHEALYFLKGQNFERLNQLDKALEVYEQALAINSESADAREALDALRPRLKK